MLCVCARVVLLQAVAGRCESLQQGQLNLWLQSISGQSVISTFGSWISVWAALMPHWGRVKGLIDKCDMLIRGWIEEKIPLSGHEGTPRDSSSEGAAIATAGWAQMIWQATERCYVMRCFCFWTPFVTVRPQSCLNGGNFMWKVVVLKQLSLQELKKPHLDRLTLCQVAKPAFFSALEPAGNILFY